MKDFIKIISVALFVTSCVGEDAPSVIYHDEVLQKLLSAERTKNADIVVIGPHVVSGCMVGAWNMGMSQSDLALARISIGNQCDKSFTIMTRGDTTGDVIASFETSVGTATWCGWFVEATTWVRQEVEPGQIIVRYAAMTPVRLEESENNKHSLTLMWPSPNGLIPEECDSKNRIVEHFDVDISAESAEFLTAELLRKHR